MEKCFLAIKWHGLIQCICTYIPIPYTYMSANIYLYLRLEKLLKSHLCQIINKANAFVVLTLGIFAHMVDNNYDKNYSCLMNLHKSWKKKKLKLVLKYTKGLKRDWKRTTNIPGVTSDTHSPHGNPRSNPTPGPGFFLWAALLNWVSGLVFRAGREGQTPSLLSVGKRSSCHAVCTHLVFLFPCFLT